MFESDKIEVNSLYFYKLHNSSKKPLTQINEPYYIHFKRNNYKSNFESSESNFNKYTKIQRSDKYYSFHRKK